MLLTIFTFIIILGLLIFVHEGGHFFAAKKAGIKIEEFGFGFPPRLLGLRFLNKKYQIIWGRKVKAEDSPTTIYSVNLIPLGGFVKIKGEQGEKENEKDSFSSRKIRTRGLVIFSGVLMNFLLCFLLLSIGFSMGTPTVLGEKEEAEARDIKIQVLSLIKDSPAFKAGIEVGDHILEVDGKNFKNIEELQKYITAHKDEKVSLKILRGQSMFKKEIIPEVLPSSQEKAVLGVGLVKTGILSYPWYEAILRGAKTTGFLLIAILKALGGIFKDLLTQGKVEAEVAGPVGIAVLTGQVVNLGFIYVLQFAALLSLNLGIINILPFPALDGGRILFLIIEKIRGKRVDQKIENLIHNIGFALLIALVILVTYRDVARWGEKISQVFKR